MRIEAKETLQVTEPKYVKISSHTHTTRASYLTIKEGSVITHGSLTLSLEDLKAAIETYEELE